MTSTLVATTGKTTYTQTATLNEQGSGIIQVNPNDVEEFTWLEVSTDNHNQEAQALVYIGTNKSPGDYIDGTTTASSVNRTRFLADNEWSPEDLIWVLFTNGIPGDKATVRLMNEDN